MFRISRFFIAECGSERQFSAGVLNSLLPQEQAFLGQGKELARKAARLGDGAGLSHCVALGYPLFPSSHRLPNNAGHTTGNSRGKIRKGTRMFDVDLLINALTTLLVTLDP
ncbi:MAG: hypothetical protein AAAB14_11045, partial [Ensifer adhaerens]